jgi:large subunit ribosomal protein L17
MLSNMAGSLILHKRITTTLAKAKELRKYVEPLINRSKEDTTHSRRIVFSYLKDKEAIKELFGNIAEKIAERPGGYTRIIKLGERLGDNAQMCIIELVDYNQTLLAAKTETRRTRRSRRGGKGKSEAANGEEIANNIQADEAQIVEAQEENTQAEEVKAEEISQVTEATAEEENKPAVDTDSPTDEETKAS